MPLRSTVVSHLRTGAAAFACVAALTASVAVPAFAEELSLPSMEADSDVFSVFGNGDAVEGVSSESDLSDVSGTLLASDEKGDGQEYCENDSIGIMSEESLDVSFGDDIPVLPTALTSEAPASSSTPLVKTGWSREGDGYVYYRVDGRKATGWLVTSERPDGGVGGLERYWLQPDGTLAVDKLIQANDGSYGYAKPDGTIVRGKWTNPANGLVYLANNDGQLEDTGWVVTGDYTGGSLERYWVDSDSHACEPGYSSEGWDHFTLSSGAVLRNGGHSDSSGKIYADNDGRLFQNGWLVTAAYTEGTLERYWFEDGHAVTSRLIPASKAGWRAYATDSGAVVRGKWTDPSNGYVYLANNDGRLENPGWVVTGAYTSGALERYWVDERTGACIPGRSSSGWDHFTTSEGYVLRGGDVVDGERVYADNNGRLVTDGWVVTSGWGQGLQRYWLRDGTVVSGELINTGSTGYAYAKDDGTILREKLLVDGVMLLADNDGKLAWGHEGWLITDAYDGGSLQRYYLVKSESGKYYGARLYRFTVANSDYYGREDTGYVVRGSYTTPDGTRLFADNDGVLGHRIMGMSQNTVEQMIAYYNSQGKKYPSTSLGRGGAPDIETFCTIIYEEAAAEGVRAEIVFTQAMLETGWLQFGGDVSVDQFNFAGIGATGGGVPGNSFPNVRIGIRAQVQHLKAYASTEPLNNACVDPRFHYVTRGSAPTMEQLAGKWAASTGYGEGLNSILSGLDRR